MFQPVLPASGLAGWRLLQRTYDVQTEYFNQSAKLQRDSNYFLENIGNVSSAEVLVNDHRMLSVALGAFGLDEDINNKFFIRKMLEEGTVAEDALANRFTDKRYKKLVEAFGFGPLELNNTIIPSKMQAIVEKFQEKQFQIAVGEQDDSYRIALYGQSELSEVAQGEGSEDSKWFTIMGQPALRKLFEGALGLPSSFSQIDLDQQLGIFKERAESVFGSSDPAQFDDSEKIDELVDKYLLQTQIESVSVASPTSIALTLLQA